MGRLRLNHLFSEDDHDDPFFVAMLTPEELDQYRRIVVMTKAAAVANPISYERALQVYTDEMNFWNHVWHKYELVSGFGYSINVFTGELTAIPKGATEVGFY